MTGKHRLSLYSKSIALNKFPCFAFIFSFWMVPSTALYAEPSPPPAIPAAPVIDSIDRDYASELPRIAPTEPNQAVANFVVEPGFQVELAAAEPLVAAPVAMEFDENGRLFVAEMCGYSEDGDKNLGVIRLLEDADQDGRFEKSTIYAEGLSWPTAITCYDGGVFVGAAPDIFYLKDTDGDNKADVRRVVFTGMGRSNVQGLMNSFRWGLDNRIHVAVSSSGAELKAGSDPTGKPLVLHGRDFAFNPRTLAFQPTSGGGQHGMSFNRWGIKFASSNSDHIQQIFIEDRYLASNRFARIPAVRKSIAADGPAADVYRISPVEPWRIVRTRLRVKNITPGIIEGGGRAAGYFTSATGVTIYTGDAWPKEFLGNAFIGDVGSNLVHRKQLDPEGVAYVARRATPGREFIASKDIWFRPVQFSNGPDGNLYIIDMYLEVIEHPLSLPPTIKKHLDLTSGRDRGRIYRVVSSNASTRKTALPVKLAEASTAQLVELLDHANGWHRRTASRLLYQHQDNRAVPLLESLSRSATHPEGRIHSLYALAGMDALHEEEVVARFADPHPRVREHAIRLAEGILDASHPAWEKLLGLADDPDPRARYQLAWTLGTFDNPDRLRAFGNLARRDADDPYICAAIYSSLGQDSENVFHDLSIDRAFRNSASGQQFLNELARQMGARGSEHELAAVANDLTSLGSDQPPLVARLIESLMLGAGPRASAVREQLAKATNGQTEQILASLLQSAKEIAINGADSDAARSQATESLTLCSFEDVESILAELLEPQQPRSVQLAALSTLSKFSTEGVADLILDAWIGLSPSVRREASATLISRIMWTKSLVDAIEEEQLQANDVDTATFERLTTHQNKDVRNRAKRLMLTRANKETKEVVEGYRNALDLLGSQDRGRDIFRKLCSICHQREGFGTRIGPDLETVITRGPEAMLISILDPSRDVIPQYLEYIIITASGRSVSGIITSDTAAGITLTRGEGKSETIDRDDIEYLQSTGMSLMPEGFEKEVDPQAMADLIAYLRSSK